ncbi:hypothetical protein JX266_013470 [Neoarthrinium moseri]|nr:hypothetical protein JX266_013470 [Neoarthrinium moseri]
MVYCIRNFHRLLLDDLYQSDFFCYFDDCNSEKFAFKVDTSSGLVSFEDVDFPYKSLSVIYLDDRLKEFDFDDKIRQIFNLYSQLFIDDLRCLMTLKLELDDMLFVVDDELGFIILPSVL